MAEIIGKTKIAKHDSGITIETENEKVVRWLKLNLWMNINNTNVYYCFDNGNMDKMYNYVKSIVEKFEG